MQQTDTPLTPHRTFLAGGCDWSYRGCISNEHPSDVFPLSWPEIAPGTVVGAGYAQIGILAESLGEHTCILNDGGRELLHKNYCQHRAPALCGHPAEEARQKEGSKLGAKEDFAKRVGLDLFNFMQSFGGVQNVGGNNILVPVNVLDAWYQRLERRLRRDPDFLTRQKDKI